VRILVVGTVPPPGGEPARALAALAARLADEGNDVEILSPDLRSASHRHARLSGVLLAANLLYFAPRFDALVLRMESDLPLHNDTGRASRAGTLFALGCALRMWKDVTIRLDHPLPLPGGVGGRPTHQLWAHATSVVVKNEEDRAVVCTAPRLDATRVIVEVDPSVRREFQSEGWVFPDGEALREQVAQLVRQRAAKDRMVNTARVSLGEHEVGPLATSAFSPRTGGPSLIAIARFALHRVERALESMRARSTS
jgi:hypothetical protein